MPCLVDDEVAVELLSEAGEEPDVAEVLPPTFDTLDGVEVPGVAEDEAEVELLSAAGELDVAEVLPPAFDKLEAVEVLGAAAGGVGALVSFCSVEDGSIAEVAGSGNAGV